MPGCCAQTYQRPPLNKPVIELLRSPQDNMLRADEGRMTALHDVKGCLASVSRFGHGLRAASILPHVTALSCQSRTRALEISGILCSQTYAFAAHSFAVIRSWDSEQLRLEKLDEQDWTSWLRNVCTPGAARPSPMRASHVFTIRVRRSSTRDRKVCGIGFI